MTTYSSLVKSLVSPGAYINGEEARTAHLAGVGGSLRAESSDSRWAYSRFPDWSSTTSLKLRAMIGDDADRVIDFETSGLLM